MANVMYGGCIGRCGAARLPDVTFNTQTLTGITFGVNWNMLRGRYGTLRSGLLQYGNIIRTASCGQGGTPSAAENLFMFNLRYHPFE